MEKNYSRHGEKIPLCFSFTYCTAITYITHPFILFVEVLNLWHGLCFKCMKVSLLFFFRYHFLSQYIPVHRVFRSSEWMWSWIIRQHLASMQLFRNTIGLTERPIMHPLISNIRGPYHCHVGDTSHISALVTRTQYRCWEHYTGSDIIYTSKHLLTFSRMVF